MHLVHKSIHFPYEEYLRTLLCEVRIFFTLQTVAQLVLTATNILVYFWCYLAEARLFTAPKSKLSLNHMSVEISHLAVRWRHRLKTPWSSLTWCYATLEPSCLLLVLIPFFFLFFLLCAFVFRWGPTSVPVRWAWMRTAPGDTSTTPKFRFSPPWTRPPSACKWAPTRGRARYCNTFLAHRKSRIAGLEWKSASMAPLTLCPHAAAVNKVHV